jgi:hypothetical protein
MRKPVATSVDDFRLFTCKEQNRKPDLERDRAFLL